MGIQCRCKNGWFPVLNSVSSCECFLKASISQFSCSWGIKNQFYEQFIFFFILLLASVLLVLCHHNNHLQVYGTVCLVSLKPEAETAEFLFLKSIYHISSPSTSEIKRALMTAYKNERVLHLWELCLLSMSIFLVFQYEGKNQHCIVKQFLIFFYVWMLPWLYWLILQEISIGSDY